VSIANFPEPQSYAKFVRARLDATGVRGGHRPTSGRIEALLDVARTLMVLLCIGTGIVLLRFLLVLARGVIGH
jgi:hypothetical protein